MVCIILESQLCVHFHILLVEGFFKLCVFNKVRLSTAVWLVADSRTGQICQHFWNFKLEQVEDLAQFVGSVLPVLTKHLVEGGPLVRRRSSG